MTANNRATRINKLQAGLKKAYKPVSPPAERTVLEHLLYACTLEDASYELADEAMARLEHEFFDWNEVRVTTVTELSEVLARLPEPAAAAARLKKNLHGLFETYYAFDLEDLKKQNLGKAIQQLEKLPAMTPFVLAFVNQHGLGGHAVPVDRATLELLHLCDIISDAEMVAYKVPGLERAVPKTKGIEFGSLLHQAAAALRQDRSDPTVCAIVMAVNPEAAERLAGPAPPRPGKKGTKKRSARPRPAEADKSAAAEKPSKETKAAKSDKPAAAKAAKVSSEKGAAAGSAASTKAASSEKTARSEKPPAAEKRSKGEKALKGDKSTPAGKDAKTPKSTKADKVPAGDKPAKAGKTDKPAKPAKKSPSAANAPSRSAGSKGAAASKGANDGKGAAEAKVSDKTATRRLAKRKPR